MLSAGEPAPPVLVYDRIAANRRNAVLLLLLFALILLPAVLYAVAFLAIGWLFVSARSVELLIGSLMVPFGGIGLTLVRPSLEPGQLVLAMLIPLAIVGGAVVLEYALAGRLVLQLVGARPIDSTQERALSRTVENLCLGAGLPVPAVYVVDSPSPNAFAAGRDPQRASLVFTRGLLDLLERRELEAIIAHELLHIGNYDIRLNTIVAAAVSTLQLPWAILVSLVRLVVRTEGHLAAILLAAGPLLLVGALGPLAYLFVAAFPFYVMDVQASPEARAFARLWGSACLSLLLYSAFGAPLLGQLLRLAISRERELLADADAVLLTRYPEGLAQALAKIGAAHGQPPWGSGATAHLYVVDPRPPAAWWAWWDRLLPTHPPVAERIARLHRLQGVPVQASIPAGRWRQVIGVAIACLVGAVVLAPFHWLWPAPPSAAAAPPSGPVVYATTGAFRLSAIELETNRELATVRVGPDADGVVLSPDGSRVYVTNLGSPTVLPRLSVIDTANHAVVATLEGSLGSLLFAPDGTRIYAIGYLPTDRGTLRGSRKTLLAIDTASHEVVAGLALETRYPNEPAPVSPPSEARPEQVWANPTCVGDDTPPMVLSPDATRLYVVDSASNTILTVDASTTAVLSVVRTDGRPTRLVITPDGSRLYVAYLASTRGDSNLVGGGTVSVIDTTTNALVATVAITAERAGDLRLLMAPAGDRVYVTTSRPGGGHAIAVIDTATNHPLAQLDVSGTPGSLCITPDGARLYVALVRVGYEIPKSTVEPIDTTSHRVMPPLTIGRAPDVANGITGEDPQDMTLSPDGRRLYVATTDPSADYRRTLWVLDTTSNTPIATVALGKQREEMFGVPPLYQGKEDVRRFLQRFARGEYAIKE